MIQGERRIAESLGIDFKYETAALELVRKKGCIDGLMCERRGWRFTLSADRIVLACGGCEANAELRERHIGPGWGKTKVRGTCRNQGKGISMALAVGARKCGNWSGCHAVFMDINSPDYGNLDIPHKQRKNYRKISYPFGIMLNARGERFVDEGADFRNYTYAKYGREALRQPGCFAWQIFDAQVTELLYEEYRQAGATKVSAHSLETLVSRLDGMDSTQALKTLAAYNAAIDSKAAFNPAVKGGKATHGITPPKSNWATSITKSPFTAYKVTCGITFTYGGLTIDNQARVLDEKNVPIPALFAAGELVGDIFHHNYLSGSGLTSGSVFGKIAGTSAAA